jgi:pilus assembly protein Flp/PilA
MRRFLAKLKHDQRGATAVEYGLIVALIVIAMIPAFIGVARVTSGMWNNVSTKVSNASAG